MHLCILRSCRQVYREASQVMWGSNIFSFSDAASFEYFMDSRTADQKTSMRKLRLIMDNYLFWQSALSTERVGSLQGLHELWLSFNHRLSAEELGEYGMLSLRQVFATCSYVEVFKELALLPLVRVEVVLVSKDLRPLWSGNESLQQAWTKRDRL